MVPLIVCIKVGTKYGPEYVNRLHAMVERHTIMPHEFLCLTDDALGLTCPTAPIETDLPGWWAKLVLFKPQRALRGRRVLFLDLDTVIVGNMDCLLEYDGQFAILRDFYQPNGYGSAIMSIEPGIGAYLWEQFTPDVMRRLHGDQDWIRANSQCDQWQDLYPGKIVSYKVHCQHGIPEGAAVICFHGEPRPHEVTRLSWMQESWHDCDTVTRETRLASAIL